VSSLYPTYVVRTVVKGDDGPGIEVTEMMRLDLEPAPADKGVAGVWLVSATSWFDLSTMAGKFNSK